VRPDLPQPTHRLEEQDTLGGILFLRLKASHLRPKFRVLNSIHYSLFVYYKSRKRELKIRLMNESRCDEKLKVRVEDTTCLTHTGLHDKTN